MRLVVEKTNPDVVIVAPHQPAVPRVPAVPAQKQSEAAGQDRVLAKLELRARDRKIDYSAGYVIALHAFNPRLAVDRDAVVETGLGEKRHRLADSWKIITNCLRGKFHI